MSFWSSKKSFGNDRHVTSRAAGEALLSLGGRDDWTGASGNCALALCDQARSGGQNSKLLNRTIHKECLFKRLIKHSWMQVSCFGYAAGCSNKPGSRRFLPKSTQVHFQHSANLYCGIVLRIGTTKSLQTLKAGSDSMKSPPGAGREAPLCEIIVVLLEGDKE